jgi:uncharacterized alkaline shock family protein YloU
MNVFNRLLVIILLLIIMGGSAVGLFFLAEAPAVIINPLRLALNNLTDVMTASPHQNRVFFAVGLGGIIWLLCGFLLWLELRQSRRTTIRVTGIADDVVEVELNAVEERLSHHLKRLADVHEVAVSIEAKRNKVGLDLLLGVSPMVNIPMKTREVQALTREVIEEQMGVEVEYIHVSLSQIADATEGHRVKLA